jgi:hypothetical protein
MNPLFILALSIIVTFICLQAHRAHADTNTWARLRLTVTNVITLKLLNAPTNTPFTISTCSSLDIRHSSLSNRWVPLLEARSNSWGTITIVLPRAEPTCFYRVTTNGTSKWE